MELDSLIKECRQKRYVSLVMKGRLRPEQVTKRFWGRRGPTGEIIAELENNEILVCFESARLLKFIEENISKDTLY